MYRYKDQGSLIGCKAAGRSTKMSLSNLISISKTVKVCLRRHKDSAVLSSSQTDDKNDSGSETSSSGEYDSDDQRSSSEKDDGSVIVLSSDSVSTEESEYEPSSDNEQDSEYEPRSTAYKYVPRRNSKAKSKDIRVNKNKAPVLSKPKKNGNLFQCSECGKYLDSKGALTRHFNVLHNNRGTRRSSCRFRRQVEPFQIIRTPAKRRRRQTLNETVRPRTRTTLRRTEKQSDTRLVSPDSTSSEGSSSCSSSLKSQGTSNSTPERGTTSTGNVRRIEDQEARDSPRGLRSSSDSDTDSESRSGSDSDSGSDTGSDTGSGSDPDSGSRDDSSSQPRPSLPKPKLTKVFQCQHCGKYVFTQESFAAHIRRHEELQNSHEQSTQNDEQISEPGPSNTRTNPSVKPVNVFECHLCEKKFQYNHVYQNHVRSHSSSTDYKCNVRGCDRAYLSSWDLENHLKETHFQGNIISDSSVNTPKKPVRVRQQREYAFECKLCGKKLACAYSLQHHIQIHNGERYHKCNIDGCTRAYAAKNNLNSHQRKYHGYVNTTRETRKLNFQDVAAKLDLNGREVVRKSFPRRRVSLNRFPATNDRLVCEICSWTCSSSSTLFMHLKYHYDIRNFKCPTCEKAFFTNQALSGHKAVHTRKKCMCPIATCRKLFLTRTALWKHSKTHN